MKHLFIINPYAGKYDRSHEIREKVGARYGRAGKDYEILVTQYAGHGEEVRRAAGWENPAGLRLRRGRYAQRMRRGRGRRPERGGDPLPHRFRKRLYPDVRAGHVPVP